jgi:hypothetical protein
VTPLLEPLRTHGRWDKTLVGACVALNAVIRLNAAPNDPTVGYDATQHTQSIVPLSL